MSYVATVQGNAEVLVREGGALSLFAMLSQLTAQAESPECSAAIAVGMQTLSQMAEQTSVGEVGSAVVPMAVVVMSGQRREVSRCSHCVRLHRTGRRQWRLCVTEV